MSKKHSVAKVFDALITQTRQRGGCPSVREISNAALAVAHLAAAYTEVRAHAVQAGMSLGLARAIENADVAMLHVDGGDIAETENGHHDAPAQETADLALLTFYGVSTAPELIKAQARHIEKLQAKLRDLTALTNNAGSGFKRVREG